MSEDLRVPSQDELERLEQSVRLDPSRHFVALGDAYLALGRPRDAVDIGARGLKSDPNNLEGRLMVGRALVALHQWKQAQAELLRVVKSDKQNREGFRLLGEVLMRRSDYERALPVLQHAQNLDPANPAVLALLKRARAGQALDPPAPIPSPRSPRSPRRPRLPQPGGGLAGGGFGGSPLDDEPTKVADDATAALDDDADTGMLSVRGDATEPAVPAMTDDPALIRDRLPLSTEGTSPRAPAPPAPPRRDKRPSAAPPVRPPEPREGEAGKIRPRIMPAERRADAAKEGLRQSAAVGEDYLNNLLAGGLLDVPNVRVPPEELEVKIEKSWSPSAKRAFVFLFTLLFLGTAGGVSWYIYSEKQKAADVAAHIDTALAKAQNGRHTELEEAIDEARAAMERDDKSEHATATFAMVGALDALLYKTDPTAAEFATTGGRRYVDPGETGDRELMVAEAAIKLARLAEMEKPREELAALEAKLEKFLEVEDDGYLRWLLGRAKLAAGNRSGAAAAFTQAENAPNPPLIATIERGDLALDDGNYEKAREFYQAVLDKSENHPLAIIGMSLLRAETATELAQAIDDLNVHVERVESPRLDAWKNLAVAHVRHALQDYDEFEERLELAVGLSEPRFWARVGLLRMRAGKAAEAAAARQRVQWFGPEGAEREEHPLVRILDAELSLAIGRPKAALSRVGKAEGLRALSVRARAHFDRGEYEEAIAEFDEALAIASEDRELEAFSLAAKALARRGKERREALEQLGDLRLSAKSKVPAYLEGLVLLDRGKLGDARYALEKSLEDITAEEPNRLAYRSHLALAEVEYRREKYDAAMGEVNTSLEMNGAYLPTLKLLGQIELRRENWGAAASSFGDVVAAAEEDAADWRVELGYAEALMKRSDSVSDEDRERASAAVERAKEKDAPEEELARVAALVGPELLEKLGLEAPEEDDDDRRRRR